MPLVAVVDGKRSYAFKDGRGTCPECNETMIAKTGDIVTHHWAHAVGSDCEGSKESPWHLEWKNYSTDPNRVERWSEDRKRRADIITPYGQTIEVQRSAIDSDEVSARENDWRRYSGYDLIWIQDAREAYSNEALRVSTSSNYDNYVSLTWINAPIRFRATNTLTILDVGLDKVILVGEKIPNPSILPGEGWWVEKEWVINRIINGEKLPSLTYQRPPWVDSPLKIMADRQARLRKQQEDKDREYRESQERVYSHHEARKERNRQLASIRKNTTPVIVKDTYKVVGSCRVCNGDVLSSSAWPDCHPACAQWPDESKGYGRP